MNKKPKTFQINKKDIEFFFYLHSLKVANTDQIKRDCYPETKKWMLYKRLQFFQREGWVLGYIYSDVGQKKLYSLTRKGFLKFLPSSEVKRNELKSDSVQHDLGLVDIRHAMMKLNRVSSYHAENILQTWPITSLGEKYEPFVRCNSDAVVEVSVNGKSFLFALEYELSLKNELRYRDIVAKYYMESNIPMVLYVVEDSHDLDKIQSIEREADKNKKAKFFYTTFKQLVQESKPTFTNWNKEVMTLG